MTTSPRRRTSVALLGAMALTGATALLAPGTTASAVSTADGRIAFYSYQDGDADIYTVNPDGTGEVNLTQEEPDADTTADADPAWSPDGTRLAYTVYTVRTHLVDDVWLMNADGSGKVPLTSTGTDLEPVWSPDGSQIAFVSTRDGNPEIFVMNTDGSGQTQLSFTEYTSFAPSNVDPVWSPDGSQIAFASNRHGDGTDFDIYAMSFDGSGVVNLTNTDAGLNGDRGPAWSPDGSKIAFWTDRDASQPCYNDSCDREVYWMNPDGTGQQNLTEMPQAVDYDPTFSPDGGQIAFVSNRDGAYALYSLDVSTIPAQSATARPTEGDAAASTETVSLITQTAGQAPDWQPLPDPGTGACTLAGTAGPDELDGSDTADVLCGRAGADSIRGYRGHDILRGGRGADALVAGPGHDLVYAGPGDDTVRSADGRVGNDLVNGGAGDDTCIVDLRDAVRHCEHVIVMMADA